MFIKALFTMIAADAVDRRMREQQHRAWVAEEQARAAAAAETATVRGFLPPVAPRT